MCVGTIGVGMLVLHHVEPRQFEPATLTDSVAFAALALRLLLDEQTSLHATLGHPPDALPLHSPQVHQATDVVARRVRFTPTDKLA